MSYNKDFNKKRVLIVLGVILLLLGIKSCTKKPQFIAIENVNIKQVKDTVLLLTMDYKAFNPNKIKVQLTKSELIVFFNKVIVGKAISLNEVDLHPNDTILVPIECQMNLKSVSKYFPQMLQNKEQQFEISGFGNVKTFLGETKVKLNDVVSLNTKNLVTAEVKKILNAKNNFKIEEIRLSEISLGNVKTEVLVLWKNPLPFNFKIISQDLTVQLGGNRKNGRIQSDTKVDVKSNEEVLLPISVKINHDPNLFVQSTFSVFFNQSIKIEIDGILKIDVKGFIFSLPVKTSKRLSIKDVLR